MDPGVLQCAQHFSRDHVARDAHDEQLPETGIEHQFGRHARITAPEDRRVRTLCFRELREYFLLDSRKTRLPTNEALVPRDESSKRFVCRVGHFSGEGHLLWSGEISST